MKTKYVILLVVILIVGLIGTSAFFYYKFVFPEITKVFTSIAPAMI